MHQGILIDTGPLVAILAKRDKNHLICMEYFKRLHKPFCTCWPIITEAAWLLKDHPPSVYKLLEFVQNGFITLLPLGNDAAPWVASFMHDYEDIRPQLADACLVYLAERESIDTIFTSDRRDFSIYRFKRNQSFNLIPAQ